MVQPQVLSRPARLKTAAVHPLAFTVLLATAALLITILKTGIGIHPEWHRLWDGAIHWLDISQSPLLAEGDASLRSNIVGSWFSGAMGFDTAHRYLLMAFLLSAVAIVPVCLVWQGALLHPGWTHLEIVQRALDGQVIRGL